MTSRQAGRWIDLTRPLNAETEIYGDSTYQDPPLLISSWCGVQDQGFAVSRLELGTQTGTHIDAPAHFLEGGATLEQLGIENLIGKYFLVPAPVLSSPAALESALEEYRDEPILLLVATPGPLSLAEEAMGALLSLGQKLWVVVGAVEVEGRETLFFHQSLAKSGIFLVEDLDESLAHDLEPGGELVALPLRLEGVSGSPCRVIVRP